MRGSCRRLLAVVAVIVTSTTGLIAGAVGESTAATAAPRSRSAPDPILLVHGFNGSPANWKLMRQRLRADGYRDRDIDAISYDSTQSNVVTAGQIATAVDDLLARTGAKRVDIISHSMGAIPSRYYVQQLGGDAHVDAWVSLAGANQGTYWAYGCSLLASCQDMLPGSAMLTTLTASVPLDGAVRFATWWSPCDPIIMPTDAATLTGARNTETSCLGHSDLTTDATVFTQVEQFVRARHRVT